MTPAEKILWQELRGKKLGVHFRRHTSPPTSLRYGDHGGGRCQGQIISVFIVDFYCHKAGLVIELDGDIHEEEMQTESDIKRDKALYELGLRVVRFRNEEVLRDLSQVIRKIQELTTIR